MHTNCLIRAMELAIQTTQDPTKTLPTYVMKCLYCHTHLLGEDHQRFNDGCLLSREFNALSDAQKKKNWMAYLPAVLESMEIVVQNIWSRWKVHPPSSLVQKRSYNPILAAALGVLASANGSISHIANDSVASTLAVFANMMAWTEAGPTAMYKTGHINWILTLLCEQMKESNGAAISKMVLPYMVAYLIVVIENAFDEDVQRNAQHFLVVVLTERTEHDSGLRSYLWKVVLSFVIKANVVGCIGYDTS